MQNKFLAAAGVAAFLMSAAAANATTIVYEHEPNDTFATGQNVGYHSGSIDIHGTKEYGGTNDWFLFKGTAGDHITIETINMSGGTLYDPEYGTFFDPTLTLLDSYGGFLAFDDDGAGGTASKITYHLAETGIYGIGVGAYQHRDTFKYVLDIDGLTAFEEPVHTPPPSSGPGPGHTTDVPEPGTLALFGLGLAGLGFARRRKVS